MLRSIFSFTSQFRTHRIAIIAAIPLLSVILTSCEDIDKEAAKNRCNLLSYEIEYLFVSGGRMREVENRIAGYIKKHGINREPFARSSVGGKRALSAMVSVENFLNGVERDSSDRIVAKPEYGDLLFEKIENYNDDYATRAKREGYFSRCRSYVNRKLDDRSYVSYLEQIYFDSAKWER